jgi:hypothetical protein
MRLPASGFHRIAATSLYTASDETHDIMGQNNTGGMRNGARTNTNKNTYQHNHLQGRFHLILSHDEHKQRELTDDGLRDGRPDGWIAQGGQ